MSYPSFLRSLRLSPATKSIHAEFLTCLAYIDHETEQYGALYVVDAVAFPLWLTVDQDTKLILMFTYIEPGDEVKVDWLDKVNTLNASIMLPQFSYRDGCMWGRYYLTYDDGLCVRHLIKMLRRFAGAFRTAVEELELSSKRPDPEHVLVDPQ